MKENMLEHFYYPIDTLSKRLGISEDDLWLHAEQGRLKFSVKVVGAEIFFSNGDYADDVDDLDTDNLPENVKYNESYSDHLQLRPRKIKFLRQKKQKKGKFHENKFLFDDEYFTHAEDARSRGAVFFYHNIVVLKKHYHEFRALLVDPHMQAREFYYNKKPFVKTTQLYKAAFAIYVSKKVESLSTKPQDVFDALKSDFVQSVKSQKEHVIRKIDNEKIEWYSPTDGEEKETLIESFKKRISEWNAHFKSVNSK